MNYCIYFRYVPDKWTFFHYMDGTKLIHQNTRNQSAICHVFVYNYFVIQIKMHILQISVVYLQIERRYAKKE